MEPFAIFVEFLDKGEASNVTSYMASVCQPAHTFVVYFCTCSSFSSVSNCVIFGLHGCFFPLTGSFGFLLYHIANESWTIRIFT